MALGPGKYGDEADALRQRYHADLVMVAMLGGDKGPGFAVTGSLELQIQLPDLLDQISASLRADLDRIISEEH